MTSTFTKRLLCGSALAAVCGLAPVTALAQPSARATPASQAAGVNLQEVVVTARRTEERLQSVPLAVTALGTQFLQEHTIQNFTQLNNYVPSLQIQTFSSPDQMIVGVRGQRNSELVPGHDPSVPIYVGEVPYGFPAGANQQLYDLQSVQVLKGPQGTLFGQSSTGGAVLLTPSRPTATFGGSLLAGLTAFSGGMGGYTTGVLNVPVNDGVMLRGALNVIQRPGYVSDRGPLPPLVPPPKPLSPTRNERLADDHQIDGRFSVLLRPTDNLESYFIFQATQLRDVGTPLHITALNPKGFMSLIYPFAQQVFQQQQAMYAHNFWTTQTGVASHVDVDTYGFSNITRWDLSGNLKLRNIIGLRHWRRDAIWDLSGSPIPAINPPQDQRGTEGSEEIQLQGDSFGGVLNWTTGLFFFDQDAHTEYGASILGGVPNSYFAHSISRSYAIYGQATSKLPWLDERLSATVGVRYTFDQRRMQLDGNSPYLGRCIFTRGGKPLPSGPACSFNDRADFETPTYTVSLNYQADPATLLYVTSRRGYRAGGFSPNATSAEANIGFRPELVIDVEGGLKKDWRFGGAVLRTNADIYYQHYTDIQRLVNPVNSPDPSLITIVNAAGANMPGGELEATLIPFSGLDLTGSLAVIHPHYTDFPTAQGNFKDNQLAEVPKVQYTLGVTYTLPLSESIGTVKVRGDYFHQSHVWYLDTAQGPAFGPLASQGQDGYGIMNFRIDWQNVMNSKVDLAFYVNNALATKYTTSTGIVLYQNVGYNAATVGDPRVFGLELRYAFGG